MFAKTKKSFHRFVRYIKWLHMLYELNTYLSMCEPWEKVFLNCLIVVSIGFIFYSTFIYIPGHIYTFILYLTTTATTIYTPPLEFKNVSAITFTMERWSNKVAVISGASAGIGAACCKALVTSGMLVVGLARRHELILKLKDELPGKLRKNLHAIRCDITQEDQVSQAFDWTQKQLGGCDVLINNAGIIATTQLSQRNNTNEIRQTIDTNLLGTVFCTREAFHSMCSQKNGNGHIVIINSVAGHQVPNLGPALPSLNIYPATKFALKAMNEIYRQEFQRHKTQVRVTTISPGIVDTDILPTDILNVVKASLPMLKSADVADAVMWALGTPPNVQVHNITIKPMGEKF